MIFAGVNKFTVAKAQASSANTVVVPLEISNDVPLAALDIPLTYSEGVTLKEVDFAGTRVEYFDFKMASIREDQNQVVIGLMPMFSAEQKPDLAVGKGVIANLVFEVTDPDITEITVEPVTLTNPNHDLLFVYHDENNEIKSMYPELSASTVSLNAGTGDLPNSFALNQNYPNPFNPTTEISFALPKASHVTLEVYNVLGQKVETLVNDAMDAGLHVISFDASSLASGMYFYRINAENFNETRKMMLLK